MYSTNARGIALSDAALSLSDFQAPQLASVPGAELSERAPATPPVGRVLGNPGSYVELMSGRV